MAIGNMLKNLSEGSNHGILFIENGQEEFVTYSQLYLEALEELGKLNGFGVCAKAKLVIFIKNKRYFIPILWACLLGGITAIPLAPTNENINMYMECFGEQADVFFVLENEIRDSVESIPYKNVVKRIIYYSQSKGKGTLNYHLATEDSENLSLVMYSSGTIFNPKGIRVKQKNLEAYLDVLSIEEVVVENDRMLMWLPLYHNASLILFHMMAVKKGIFQIVVGDRVFFENPSLFFELIDKYEVSISGTVSSLIPMFSNNFPTRNKVDLSSLKCLITGAEPLNYNDYINFEKKLQEHGSTKNIITLGYGLTESVSMISSSPRGQALNSVWVNRSEMRIGEKITVEKEGENTVQYVSVGRPYRGIEVRIVSEDGMQLQNEVFGIIELKGKPIVTESTDIEDSGKNEWFNTGDLGFLYQGELYVTGRFKDMFLVGGKNYYCSDIEKEIQKGIGLNTKQICILCMESKQIGERDRVLCFLECKLIDYRHLCSKIYNHIFARLQLAIDMFVWIEELPRVSSGKVQKHVLKQRLRNGTIMPEYVYEMNARKITTHTEKEIQQDVLSIFQQIYGPEVDIDMVFKEFVVKSLQFAEFQLIFEKIYNIPLELSEIISTNSIRELSCVIKRKIDERV